MLADQPFDVPPLLGDTDRKGPWGAWATIGWTLLILVGFIGSQVAAFIAFAAIGFLMKRGAFDPNALESNGALLAIATCLSGPVTVGLCALFVKMRRGPSLREYLSLHWPGKRIVSRWCIMTLLLLATSDLLTTLLGKPIVPEFMTSVFESAGWALPLLWIALIVGAPFGEEFVFRGFLFTGLSQSKMGIPLTIILTSALWACIHLQYDFYGIASIFVGGIFLGFARWKTGSLYLCILLHGIINLVATIETFFFTKWVNAL